MDEPNFKALGIWVRAATEPQWADVVWPELWNIPSIGQCVVGKDLENRPVLGYVHDVALHGEGCAVVAVSSTRERVLEIWGLRNVS